MLRTSGLLALIVGLSPLHAASPLVAYRTELVAEPDRDSLVAWCYDGNLDLVWTLGNVNIQTKGTPQTESYYDPSTHGEISLPNGMKAGSYKLDAGRGPELTINVVSPPVRRTATIPPDIVQLRAKIAAGFNDITIQSGTVWVDKITSLPDWLILRCDKVVFRRKYTGDALGNWAMFSLGDRVSIYGAEFIHDKQPGNVFYSGLVPLKQGLVLVDCRFYRCDLGYFLKQAYVRDCKFIDAGCAIAPHGLYQRCRFTGCMQDPWRWCYTQDLTPTAQIDCEYRNTTRGRTFAAAAGLSDFLAVGTSYTEIDRVGGGAELDLFEGFGVIGRFTFLHTRVRRCVGSWLQVDHSANGIYARDVYIDGGQGILLWADVGCANVVVQDFELRNAGVWLGRFTTGADFTDGSIFDFSTGRHNSNFQQTGPQDLSRTVAAYAEGPNAATNTLTRIRIEPLSGYTASQGFTSK